MNCITYETKKSKLTVQFHIERLKRAIPTVEENDNSFKVYLKYFPFLECNGSPPNFDLFDDGVNP